MLTRILVVILIILFAAAAASLVSMGFSRMFLPIEAFLPLAASIVIVFGLILWNELRLPKSNGGGNP